MTGEKLLFFIYDVALHREGGRGSKKVPQKGTKRRRRDCGVEATPQESINNQDPACDDETPAAQRLQLISGAEIAELLSKDDSGGGDMEAIINSASTADLSLLGRTHSSEGVRSVQARQRMCLILIHADWQTKRLRFCGELHLRLRLLSSGFVQLPIFMPTRRRWGSTTILRRAQQGSPTS